MNNRLLSWLFTWHSVNKRLPCHLHAWNGEPRLDCLWDMPKVLAQLILLLLLLLLLLWFVCVYVWRRYVFSFWWIFFFEVVAFLLWSGIFGHLLLLRLLRQVLVSHLRVCFFSFEVFSFPLFSIVSQRLLLFYLRVLSTFSCLVLEFLISSGLLV